MFRWIVFVVLLVVCSCKSSDVHLRGATTNAWTVPNWYFDPSNASGCAVDSNTCTRSTCDGGGVGPCLTFAEIVRRLGTTSPVLTQATTFTQLSDELSPSADIVELTPSLHAPGGALHFSGTLVQVATTTIGVWTAVNRTAGTPAQITASGQSGAFWTPFVGLQVHDTTNDAWFWIEKDLGAATAQITQPMQAETFPNLAGRPAYVTIANGDALTIYRPTKVAVGNFYRSSQQAVSSVLMDHVDVVNAAGPNGLSEPTFNQTELAQSSVESGVILTANPAFSGSFIVNCYINATSFEIADVIYGGALVNFFSIGGSASADIGGGVLIDYNGTGHIFGAVQFGDAYLSSVIDMDSNHAWLGLGNYDVSTATLWGPAGLDVRDGTILTCYGGCTANLLLKGILSMHGSTVGYPWVPASHAYGAAVTITSANIDANNGLFDPRTGDGFLNHP